MSDETTDTERVKLVSFKVVNYAGIVLEEVAIDGNMCFISGKNGSGKTRMISAVMYGLEGETKHTPPNIDDKSKGPTTVWLDCGRFTIFRKKLESGNQSLIVKDSLTGKNVPGAPQGYINKMKSSVVMAPVDFAEVYNNEKRIGVLYEVTGIKSQVEKMDKDEKVIFDARTEVNRKVVSLTNRIEGLPADQQIKRQSTTELFGRLKDAQAADKTIDEFSNQIKTNSRTTETNRTRLIDITNKVVQLEKDREMLIASIDDLAEKNIHLSKMVDDAPPSEVEAIESEINNIDEHNKQADLVEEARTLRIELATENEDSQKKTGEIDDIKAEKVALLKSTNLPDGISIENGEIMVNDRPWDSQSTAERILMAMRIGNLLKHEIRLMMVGWDNLDSESRKVVADYATEHDYTMLVETVANEPQDGMIYLEDGKIQGAETS